MNKTKPILSMILLFSISFHLIGCTSENTDSDESNTIAYPYSYTNSETDTDTDTEHIGLVYYWDRDGGDLVTEIIEKYNKYCINNHLDDSYKIEVVEFSGSDELYTKISTEVMAGDGPDFFSLGQTLPFEKMMADDCFYDIEKLFSEYGSDSDLKLSDCNSSLIDSVRYNGKLCYVPLFYGIKTFVSDTNTLGKFDIDLSAGASITYDNLKNIFSSYFYDQQKYAFLFGDSDGFFYGSDELFYEFICDYVDVENGTTYFDTDSFRQNLDTMCELLKTREGIDASESLNNYIFSTRYLDHGIRFLSTRSTENPELTFYNGLSKSKDDITAYIQIGIAVNKNSEKKKQIYEFIKYCLSEDTQTYFCGDREYSTFSGLANVSFAVNNNAFEHSIEMAVKEGLDLENNGFMKNYIETVKNVNKCDKYLYTIESYYSRNVIRDIVNDYLSGTISKDKFIYRLTAATEIYFSE